MKRFFAVFTITLAASFVAVAFAPQSVRGFTNDPKATPAYSVLVLRKAAVEADLADLSSKLTDDSVGVRAKRFELNAISREMDRMQTVARDSVPKLSNAYGNLILSKVALEVELNGLLNNYTSKYPDVKKKMAEIDALEREIGNLLK